MKFKAKTRIVALAITAIMLLACVPVAVSAAQTTPLSYGSAANGALLYTVDFSSKNFTLGSGTGWVKNVANANAAKSGNTLKLDYSTATQNVDDQMIVGTLKNYSLAGNTYTLDFDFSAKTGGKRAKIAFGYGTFAEQTDTSKGIMFLEVDYDASKPFRCMKGPTTMNDSNAFSNLDGFVKQATDGVYNSHFKIVLSGKTSGSNVIVTYTIYSKGADGKDLIHKKNTFTTPSANAYVTLGVGNWDKITADGQGYSISNVNVYKGDTADKFDFEFQKKYDAAKFGEEIMKLDTSGIGMASKNNINGYAWVQQPKGVTIDTDGFIYCNPTGTYSSSSTGYMCGIKTTHPFADEWNYGYYTMEFALNSNARSAVHVLDVGTAERIGFVFGGNGERPKQGDGTTDIPDFNYVGQNFACGGNLRDSATDSAFTALNNTGAKFIAYETGAVRVVTGSKINVKIEFNCVDKVITMYEKTEAGWVKVAALDYSGVTSSTTIKPIFSIHAWDYNANVVIKNVRYIKGLSMSHFVKYSAGEISSQEYYGAKEADMNAFIDEYKEKYNLADKDIKGWTANGTTNAVDLQKLYDEISDDFYGVKEIKLVPLVNYAELTEGIALRGVRFTPVESAKYNVNFVAALGENIEDYAYAGFDVVKVNRATSGGRVVKEELSFESDSVVEKIKCDGTNLNARIFGGKYLYTVTLADQVALSGSQTDYYVRPYVVTIYGEKIYSGEVCFTFVNGAYTPTATPLDIPQ